MTTLETLEFSLGWLEVSKWTRDSWFSVLDNGRPICCAIGAVALTEGNEEFLTGDPTQAMEALGALVETSDSLGWSDAIGDVSDFNTEAKSKKEVIALFRKAIKAEASK